MTPEEIRRLRIGVELRFVTMSAGQPLSMLVEYRGPSPDPGYARIRSLDGGPQSLVPVERLVLP